MQKKKESQHTLLGPFAILSTPSDIQWIQFTLDQTGKVTQFKTANTAQFVQNDWQINTEIPSKLSVYSPGVEKPEFCFVFTPQQVIRFYFSPKGNPWPGEPFINGLFRHASIRGQGVTSNDWWHPNESLLVQINQQYHEWQQHIQQGQSLTETWHEDQEIKPFDFIHDDQGNKKNLPETVLSLKDASEIQQCIFEDWSDLKAASKHSKEYCQALRLLLSPTLLPEDLTELPTVLAEKVVSLQKWFLPTVINKFSKRLNPSEESTIFIADIQSYLHNLVVSEITHYFPEQVLPPFIPEEKFRTTKIGAMTDQMGQLLFQFTEAISEESQQQLLKLRQLMSGVSHDTCANGSLHLKNRL